MARRGGGFRGAIDEFFFLSFVVRFLCFISSSPERDGQYHVQLAVAFLACEEGREGPGWMSLHSTSPPKPWAYILFALRHGSCVYPPSHILSGRVRA